jgi:hypothetical protein
MLPARRLVLVRHGRPAHPRGGWYDAAALRGWFDAYDAAGLAADDAPPPALAALARDAAIVAASDLPRAEESAVRLAPDAPVVLAPLLRETLPAFPALGPVRLPLAGWALAVGVGHAVRSARGIPPAPVAELRQAREAAAWLAGLADAHGLVVAVTHANVRGLIAGALAVRGWAREPVPRSPARRFAHWSAWTFAPTAAAADAAADAAANATAAAAAAARARPGRGAAHPRPSSSTPTS